MAEMTASAGSRVDSIQSSYMAMAQRRRLYSGIMLALFVVFMVAGFNIAADRNGGKFWPGLPNFFDYPSEVVGEAIQNASELPGHFVTYFPALVETVNIAAAATLIGVFFGIIFSLLGTRGLALWPGLIPVFRRMTDILRAIPEIVIALVLIFILGGGPVPAMIAIAFHTAGAMGKLFSEVNENADLKPIEGLSSVGANWSQRMMLGVVPQVAPNWLSYSLLRFEINIRASAILGFVGAGGLGYELKTAIQWGQGRYADAVAMFILLFLTIVLVDQLSSYFRDKLTHGNNPRKD